MITVRSTINLAHQSVPNIIPVVQGDTGRAILFTLADFTIPEGATARYFVMKPSGLSVYNDATIDGNTVLVELTAQSIIETGDNYGQVRISVGEDIVTSFDFILHVDPFRGIDAVESSTETNIFDQAVDEARERMEEAAQETIESIPADYTALSNKVDDLKGALTVVESVTGISANILPYITTPGAVQLSDGKPKTNSAAITDYYSYSPNYIPVEEGQKLIYTLRTPTNYVVIAFYSTASEASYDATKSVEGTGGISTGVYTVPADGYIRITTRNEVEGKEATLKTLGHVDEIDAEIDSINDKNIVQDGKISNVETLLNGGLTRSNLSDTYQSDQIDVLFDTDDLNTCLSPNVYRTTNGVGHAPTATGVYHVIVFQSKWQNNTRKAITQIAVSYNASAPIEMFMRTAIVKITNEVVWSNSGNWAKIVSDISVPDYVSANALQNGLKGKKIVLMGDSTYAITGTPNNRVANILSSLANCTVYDCSFGGTRMSDSRDPQGVDSYKYFDFPRLVDAIVSDSADKWSDQENNLSGKGDVYAANLATLESVDFSNIDILCIEYGANDFTGNVALGDGTSDKTTYTGAFAYCFDALMTAYPNLTIVCDGVRYRAWLDEDDDYSFVDDVFDHENSLNLTTLDYIAAMKEQTAKCGVPYFNNLSHYGWNKYNRSVYFPANSGPHFNLTGVKYASKALYANLEMIGKANTL